MKSFFTHNIGWKLLALGAAVLLWISVASEPDLAAFVSVRVEYKNLSPDVEIDSDVVETVLLEVHGPSGALSSLPEDRRRYAVILDMGGIEPGQHTFTIDRSNVRLPRGVQLVRSVPAQIRLNFEPSATRRVPVELRFADDTAAGSAASLTPPLSLPPLAVSGPASRVARIASVQIDPLRVKPQPGAAEYRVSAYVQDAKVRFQDSPRVTVKVTVGKK